MLPQMSMEAAKYLAIAATKPCQSETLRHADGAGHPRTCKSFSLFADRAHAIVYSVNTAASLTTRALAHPVESW